MATTSNTYTGNGSNKLFSITFPYLETSDIDGIINVGDPVNLQDAVTKVWVSSLAFTGVTLPDFQFDGGFANSTYGGTFLFLDGGNA
jgi:hypothetical protein